MKKFVAMLLCFLVLACGPKVPHRIIPDYGKKGIRLIAVMPIEGRWTNEEIVKLFRNRILEGVYFKGYPKIPLEVIDNTLEPIYKTEMNEKVRDLSMKVVKEKLKVDAALYCRIEKFEGSRIFFYLPYYFAASCELRSMKTGESLWDAHYEERKRLFGYSSFDLTLKKSQTYEAIVWDVAEKIVETLPEGPELVE